MENKNNNKLIFCTRFGNTLYWTEPQITVTRGWDCILFTDREEMVKILHKDQVRLRTQWTIKYVPDSTLCSKLVAKKYKILIHNMFPQYEYSIYIDADKYIIDCDLDKVLRFLRNNKNLALLKHKTDNSILIRKSSKKLLKAMEEWWSDINNYCIRDQRSLPFNHFRYYYNKSYPDMIRYLSNIYN